MHSLAEKLLFFRQFIAHPKMIGSVIPSSSALIDALLSRVEWENTRLIVEYGPGLGTFTRPILDRLGPNARLVAIDTNPEFVDYLRRTIADPRLKVVNGSAADVEDILGIADGGERADHVLSGLPLSTLPSGVADLIAQNTARALRPGGSFLVYQYSRWFIRVLEPWFGRIDIGRIWQNIPPTVIAEARNDSAPESARQIEPSRDLVIEHANKKVA